MPRPRVIKQDASEQHDTATQQAVSKSFDQLFLSAGLQALIATACATDCCWHAEGVTCCAAEDTDQCPCLLSSKASRTHNANAYLDDSIHSRGGHRRVALADGHVQQRAGEKHSVIIRLYQSLSR